MISPTTRRGRGQAQRDVLEYILEYKFDPANNAFSPSYREIAERMKYRSHVSAYNVVKSILDQNLPGVDTVIDIDHRGRIIVPRIEISLKVNSTSGFTLNKVPL